MIDNKHILGMSLQVGTVLGILTGAIYSWVSGAPIMGCIVGSIFALTAGFMLVQSCNKKTGAVLLILMIVKYSLTLYQAINKNLPMGGEDWWNYHNNAQALMEKQSGIIMYLLDESADMFSKCVAVLYSIFGVHTMYINLFVLATSFMAAYYVLQTALLLTDYNRRVSYQALLVFCFWPIDIIYSVTYLREMPMQMLTILSFYKFCYYIKYRKVGALVNAFISIALACMMHSGVIAIIPIYLMLMFRSEKNIYERIVTTKNVTMMLLAIVVLRISPFWATISAKLGDISSVDSLVKRSQQFNVAANTQYVSEMPTSIAGFFLQMPWRALLFAVVPLPWMIVSGATAFAWVVDALPQLWIIMKLIQLNKLTLGTKQRIYYIACVLSVIGTYLVCGMGTSAYGNAIRHRAKIVPMILVFVVAVYQHLKTQKEEVEYGKG